MCSRLWSKALCDLVIFQYFRIYTALLNSGKIVKSMEICQIELFFKMYKINLASNAMFII